MAVDSLVPFGAGWLYGRAGWMLVTLAILFTQGQAASAMRLSSLPMLGQAVAFLVPAGVASAWLFSALDSSH